MVRHVGRLLNGHHGSTPFELVTDGDLLVLVDRVLRLGGHDTVRITKVKGHADDDMVLVVIFLVSVVGGILLFLIFIGSSMPFPGLLLTMMGMMVLLLILWSGPLVLWLVHAVRDLAMLPGPPAIWTGDLVHVPVAVINAEDVAHWPYTPGVRVAFLGSLHWPVGGADLGVGGVSYVELLVLYELWAGERLTFEKAHPRYLRPGRPISVSAVPFGPGIDICRSCRFIAAMTRSLCLLPGGLGRFVPCSIGANHCRLRHIGWEKCGHGLTSRPRETSTVAFLDELLVLFRYPLVPS